jgi:5-methylcytosine-specific restriction endonuclease McrA|tara:strand:+ start:384 stop:620 length:237 start_codon:yes stop_codon:yes gene_type:complete
VYCGKSSVEDAVELHVDHVHPKSKGGKDTCSNLITSCSECNVAKGSKILKKADEERILQEIKKRNLKNGVNPEFLIKF